MRRSNVRYEERGGEFLRKGWDETMNRSFHRTSARVPNLESDAQLEWRTSLQVKALVEEEQWLTEGALGKGHAWETVAQLVGESQPLRGGKGSGTNDQR